MSLDPNIVPVTVKGFTWGAAAGWGTFIVISGTVAAIFRAVGLARIVELLVNRGKDLRAEERTEKAESVSREERLQSDVNKLTVAFGFLANAVTISLSALSIDNPKARDAEAERARELVVMAASTLGDTDPFHQALGRLAHVPGVRKPA